MKIEKNSTVTKRYAKSLIDLANDNNHSLDKAFDEIKTIKETFLSSKELYEVMTNPVISKNDKEEIIDAVFKNNEEKYILNFLKLLIEKNRFDLIFSIIEVFYDLYDEIKNIVKANVTCAIELNDEKKNKIQSILNEKLNKNVEVKYNVDNSIIAGLVFKIGDDVLDTSIHHKLKEFKKEILK